MRKLGSVFLACSVILSGCSDQTEMPDLRTQLTPETVQSLPIEVLLVEVPEASSAALMVRVSINGARETWRSEADQSLTMEDGVVVATRGLAFDVMGSEIGLKPADVARGRTSRTTAVRSYSFLDGENRMSTVSYECQYSIKGPEPTPVRNFIIPLLFVEEFCPRPGEDLLNKYYFDSFGNIISSSQWIGDSFKYATVAKVN